MPSQEKLIKQGIKYTDALFAEISKRIEQGVLSTDTLEAFLDKYHKAYPDNGNPLVTLGYDKEMIKLILSETNNHRFTRPSQKELVRVTIENRVGENIVDVGDEIRDSVRDIVKDGYNQALSQDEIAENISGKVSSIKNRRARAIARTEIARAATVSDYIINKEMGATHFYVECRNTACPVCKEAWHNKWTPENDSSFSPSDTIAGGKGWIGDKTYSMNDTKMLPPLHPNSYHKDTQVFTEHGWRYIAELTGDEKLLSLNPEDDSLEFIKPVRLFKHKEPQLVHMHNKWFDVCVTPDHDCFVHKRRDGGKKGRYFEPQFRKPSDLNSECHFVRCIDTDRESPEAININGLEFEPSDFAFFMAWYISEGSVLHDVEKAQKRKYPIYIAQQLMENREIIQPVLEKMCDYLGLKMNITKNSFVIYSKELYDYLLPLGYSNEKYIPSEVFTLSKECLNVFLDNYVRGDGHERTHGRYNSVERSVFTSSVRLRDDLSYLILLCGYCPSISVHSHKGTVVEHRNGTYTQNYDIYGIRINSSKYASYSGLTVDRVDYDDYTYCVELPKWHTLWVMRNGKTSWNGNCRCVPYFINDGTGKPVKGVLQDTPVKQQTTGTVEEPTYHKLDSTNELMGDGKYVKYDEVSEHGREFEVYKFDNIEIAVEKGTDISIERFARHLNNLPKEMVELSNAKRIEFCIGDVLKSEYGGTADAAGLYYSDKQQLSLYKIDKGEGIKDWILSTFDHEFSHSIDLTREGKIVYSHPEVYDKIVRLDNKFHGDELVDVFPTEYAGAGYLNYPTSGRFPERRYLEDFAESSKLYLRPTTHKEFCEKFPNRAKYLEGIYGKPKLKNVEYSDANKIVKPVQHYSKIDDVVKEYDSQLNDIDNELAKLDEARDNAKQKQRACETEECAKKWSTKRRELRTERKRLNKVKEELFDERYEIAKRKYK